MTLEEFTNFASKNNMVVIPTDIYSKMVDDTVTLAKYKKELEQCDVYSLISKIRADISNHVGGCGLYNDGLDMAISIIDKHLKDFNA